MSNPFLPTLSLHATTHEQIIKIHQSTFTARVIWRAGCTRTTRCRLQTNRPCLSRLTVHGWTTWLAKKDHITAKTYPIVEGRHKYPSRHRRPWRPGKVHNNTTRRWEHGEHNNLAQREPIIVCFTTSRPMFPATSTNNPVPVGRCLSQHARKAPITAEQHSDNAEVISSCLQATHSRSPLYCRCKVRLATLPSAEGALKWSISVSLLGSHTKQRKRNGAAAIRAAWGDHVAMWTWSSRERTGQFRNITTFLEEEGGFVHQETRRINGHKTSTLCASSVRREVGKLNVQPTFDLVLAVSLRGSKSTK